eukprot:1804712-Prymnesium_polylepis.1
MFAGTTRNSKDNRARCSRRPRGCATPQDSASAPDSRGKQKASPKRRASQSPQQPLACRWTRRCRSPRCALDPNPPGIASPLTRARRVLAGPAARRAGAPDRVGRAHLPGRDDGGVREHDRPQRSCRSVLRIAAERRCPDVQALIAFPWKGLEARSEQGHPVRGGQGGVYWWR